MRPVIRVLFVALLAGAAIVLVTPFCRAGSVITPSELDAQKKLMMERHLKGRGITHRPTLQAMADVPRERFVPDRYQSEAYADHPLPIGQGQTISQPYIVALMTQLLRPEKSDIVLEIGTGSGYQAAVLSLLVGHVYTIEIVDQLAQSAQERLFALNYDNVTVRAGDGYKGWPEEAPFDKIIVTAAAASVPQPLEEQLKEGGILVMPVGGSDYQELLLGRKVKGEMRYSEVTAVRFVPMTGEAEKEEK